MIDRETREWMESFIGGALARHHDSLLQGQERIVKDISALRAEMDLRFNAMSAEMNGRFDMVESELHALSAAERDNARDVRELREKVGG